MVKNLIRSLVFLLIFALLVIGISPVFAPKNNTEEAGLHDVPWNGFLAEPENTIDVLFIGDSECYNSFIPLQIWEEYGITSYMCGGGNLILCKGYSYLQEVLKTQQPKLVILETNILYREFTVSEYASHMMERLLPVFQYHDRWKNLTAADFVETPEYTNIIRDKGHALHFGIEPRSVNFQVEETDEVEPVPVINAKYVRLFRDYCRERGIEFMLVSAPNARNWSVYHHNGTSQLARELGIPFEDLNMIPEEVPVDLKTDTYDGGEHLNYFGATKATTYLGRYLWDTGLFEDKKSWPEYADWNTCLEDFRAEVAQQIS